MLRASVEPRTPPADHEPVEEWSAMIAGTRSLVPAVHGLLPTVVILLLLALAVAGTVVWMGGLEPPAGGAAVDGPLLAPFRWSERSGLA